MSYKDKLTDAWTNAKLVTVDRASAAAITGRVHSVDDSGAYIEREESHTPTYIQFDSMRGVTMIDWDMETLAEG